MPNWIDKWDGGRVKQNRRGQRVWVLEQQHLNRPYTMTLPVRSEAEALAELALFRRDRVAYVEARSRERAAAAAPPAGSRKGDASITADRVESFLTFLRAEKKSEGYVAYVKTYLADWTEALDGRDLRDLTLADLRAALATWDAATHKRIVALKSYTAWLRREGELKRNEDPTLDLDVPAVKATRAVEDRSYTAKQIEQVYAALTNYSFAPGWGDDAPESAPRVTVDLQPVRDVFLLRALAGMHGSEIERLAKGEGVIRELKGYGKIAGTLFFPHKKGGGHVVSVGTKALAAAMRLQAAGSAPNRMLTCRAIRRVLDRDPKLQPRNFRLENLRHSWITLTASGGELIQPKNAGVPLDVVAQIAGHTNTMTTRKHYLGVYIPPMAVVPLVLVNADDPA